MFVMGSEIIYTSLLQSKKDKIKKLAVLIDPDRMRLDRLEHVIENAVIANADYFFLGGSLIIDNKMEFCIEAIRAATKKPIVLFPSSPTQIHSKADAILFLSLISGRNPDYLISQHVIAAPMLRKTNLEVLPTGYMLIDGGTQTTASYISNTTPLPAHKDEIALCTAMAGEYLGLKLLYLDAGSGAKNAVPTSMIEMINLNVKIPIIVGGGIRTPNQACESAKSGADVIVVGNIFEKYPELVIEMTSAIHSLNKIMVNS